MKIALKLLLAYLLASFVMTAFSVALHPSHPHIPAAVALLFFPLVPALMFRAALTSGLGWAEALSMGVFVLVFGGAAWFAFRRRVAADRAETQKP
ncbi:hypothetical protein [Variovorax boronicumulans]|uniref:hypothetical protein n=1 Tax=Variovorax boronicumulans TaxID=436515 RepID=UPI00339A44EE